MWNEDDGGVEMDSSIDLYGFLEMLQTLVGEFCIEKGTPLYLRCVETEDESAFSLHRMCDDKTGVVFNFYKGVLIPSGADA